MNKKELSDEYFDWMCQLVCDKRDMRRWSYQKLLHHLQDTEFEYHLPMDENRVDDGINLRYRFGYEKGYDKSAITEYLSNRPCSVFEMMAALALRCEESIMWDPDIGNRTSIWFWSMITNLGLDTMDDEDYDPIYTDDILFRFMDRQYKRNGEGGLFKIPNCKYDLRSIEIWWQLNWYLDSILTDGKEKTWTK